jgi:exodeoxyribonuclease VII small subunit
MAMDSADGELSFEEAFARLEETVGRLEGAGLTVDEMVAQFERGMRLARLCYDRLNDAQTRVTVLIREAESFGTALEEASVEGEGEDEEVSPRYR